MLRKALKILPVILIICGCGEKLFSQDEKGGLELPPIIIEKKGSLSVRSGGKKDPDKTPRLSERELDSLNSLEKEKTFLLPTKHLPDKVMNETFSDGYIEAEFGAFLTPAAEFGYGIKAGGDNEYDFFINAKAESSDGHTNNANYNKGYASLNNVYIAPDKFWIFGGSRTLTKAYISSYNYNLYSIEDSVPNRSKIRLGVSIDNEGYYSGVKFETGAALNTLQLKNDQAKAFDNWVMGYLKLKSDAGDFEIGGKAKIDLHSIRGDGLYYTETAAIVNYFSENFSFNLDAGYQLTKNTIKDTRGAFLLNASAELRFSKIFTIRAGAENGMKNASFFESIYQNPYLNHQSQIDFMEGITAKGEILFHPVEELAISIIGSFGTYDVMPVYLNESDGSFGLSYFGADELSIEFELDWNMDFDNIFTANLRYKKSELDTLGAIKTYTPELRASAQYNKTWFGFLGSTIGVAYIGERFADLDNKTELDSYMDLFGKIEIKFSDSFSLFGRFENLLNNNIYVWEGYKERGIFFSGGLLWSL